MTSTSCRTISPTRSALGEAPNRHARGTLVAGRGARGQEGEEAERQLADTTNRVLLSAAVVSGGRDQALAGQARCAGRPHRGAHLPGRCPHRSRSSTPRPSSACRTITATRHRPAARRPGLGRGRGDRLGRSRSARLRRPCRLVSDDSSRRGRSNPLTPNERSTRCSARARRSAASQSTTCRGGEGVLRGRARSGRPPRSMGLMTLHLAGDRPTLVYPKPGHEAGELTRSSTSRSRTSTSRPTP